MPGFSSLPPLVQCAGYIAVWQVLGWEASWVSALADLGISLFLKDQNKYKLLRYGVSM